MGLWGYIYGEGKGGDGYRALGGESSHLGETVMETGREPVCKWGVFIFFIFLYISKNAGSFYMVRGFFWGREEKGGGRIFWFSK